MATPKTERAPHNLKARVCFMCNTRQQAIKVANKASKKLPEHCRVSIERASEGGWGLM